MNLYLAILRLFLENKRVFEKYHGAIDRDYSRNNFPEVYRLFLACEELRKKFPDRESFGVVDLEASLLTLYPNADRSVYAQAFNHLESQSSDPDAIEGYLRSLHQRVVASELAFKALEVAEGKIKAEALGEIVERLGADFAMDAPSAEEGEFVTDDINVLLERAYASGGFNWRLESLNRSLGPLRKGDFGFLFARPETGKTTFLASEVSYMATQTEAPIIWVNNEEGGDKVGIRCYEAALGATLEQIRGHPARAFEAYKRGTGSRIRIKDYPGITRNDVERLCRLYEPALLVVDQLDKVGGFDGDREDLRMGAIYQWAREIAKRHCPVIGVSQADGSAEGVKYLNMGHVANAKTAKQAEADWILGIGMKFEDHPLVRGLSICKNKLLGGEKSVVTMRHGKWDVLIQPEIGRYTDMEGYK